ncbi:MAG TPA: hypothetical protein VGJ03_05700 [Acidimicrobiales bacterium]
MTDYTDDELVSAVLDGEATEEELARVSRDPELSARLRELEAARDLVASTPISAAPATARDDAVARAIAVMPASLEARRRQNARKSRAARVVAIAAAVVVLAAVVGGILALATRGRTQSSATSAAASGSGSSSGRADTGAALPPAPATAAPVTTDLGSYASREALVASLRQAAFGLESGAPSQGPEQGQDRTATGAAQQPAAGNAGELSTVPSCASHPDTRLVGTAVLAGRNVVVFVYGSAGHETVEVYDTSCTLLLTQPL